MIRRIVRLTSPVLLTVLLGVCIEWLLLTGSSPQAVVAAIQGPTPTPIVVYNRPDFQTGVVFPQWGATAYSHSDRNWGIGLSEIQQQTASRWIEMPVNLYQPALAVPEVTVAAYTPTPDSVYSGIRSARAAGYHVFVVPLLTVGTHTWAGVIRYSSPTLTRRWFDSYWSAFQPYVRAAAQAGADQLAIGTELGDLESAPSHLWNALIAHARAVFSGALTYDLNFTSLGFPVRPWMDNPSLTYIGVSEYQSLVYTPRRLDPIAAPLLWQDEVQARIDDFSLRLGKPLVVAEVGFRNSADTFYHPWSYASTLPPDPGEQAAAYNAVLQDVLPDPHIVGVFFWAWSVQPYEPNWLPAAQVLHRWYTSPQA
jgi:hypothetical protein